MTNPDQSDADVPASDNTEADHTRKDTHPETADHTRKDTHPETATHPEEGEVSSESYRKALLDSRYITGPPAWTRALAGTAGAAFSLGFGELMGGIFSDMPSLVDAIGKLVIEYTPGDVIEISIELLGSMQKTLLTTGIVLMSLLIGGVLGRFTTSQQRLATVLGFAVFGIVGGWAAARDPSSSDATSWRVGALAAILGIFVTLFLINRAAKVITTPKTPTTTTRPDTTPKTPTTTTRNSTKTSEFLHIRSKISAELTTRRTFLAWVGTTGAAAIALTGIGKKQRAVELIRDQTNLPPSTNPAPSGDASSTGDVSSTLDNSAIYNTVSPDSPVLDQVAALDTFDEIPDLTPYIVPNSQFYRIDTAPTPPKVDPNNWSLSITGMVDTPYELTFDEILDMDLSDYVITLSCVSNEIGGGLVGNAVWTGVPLHVILDRAGVQSDATQVVGRSVDGWTAGFPTDLVYDGRNAVLAVGMNGEPLPIRHGFPARLVIAGLYGYVSAVKWLKEIELTTWDGFDGYWVPRGWSKEGPMKTQSRIDVPRNNSRVKIGDPTPIAGVAWAPTRGISKVEVRIGEGEWMTCEIGEALGKESWVQWTCEWTPTETGEHRIQVRSTDGLGDLQGRGPVSRRPNGAEGWHAIKINAHTT